MDADFDAILAKVMAAPSRGSAPTIMRELTTLDLPKLLAAPAAQNGGELKRIRAAHHQVAMLLARGLTNIEVAAQTGYTPQRVVQLRQSPAFEELVEHYLGEVREANLAVVQRMSMLSLTAIEELQERLETAPEKFRVDDLTKLATSMLDRTGFGPTTKIEQKVGLDESTIAALKARAQPRGTIIDANSYRVLEPNSNASNHHPTPISEAERHAPESGVGEGEAEGAGEPPAGPQLRADRRQMAA